MRPKAITLRSYQVGFGDCFLLSVSYGREERHVLVDFGTTGLPDGIAGDQLDKIAQDIKARTKGKLHMVVATHRHKDHISGFATKDSADGSGDVIRGLEPELVVQPWTETPDLAVDATAPTAGDDDRTLHLKSLCSMHLVAARAVEEVRAKSARIPARDRDEIGFIGDDNLSNLAAVKNLANMAKTKQLYVHAGFDLQAEIGDVLPGVVAHVLGPPTLDQSDAIRKQRRRDDAEFWHLYAHGALDAPDAGGAPLPTFMAASTDELPPSARWLASRLDTTRTQSLLGIVRALDKAMNNTSVILLLEVRGKKLLFPGDAQIECWQYALEGPDAEANKRLLFDVDLYKVGHHGSLNATPKTLWEGFERRSDTESASRLVTVMSTMQGKHGNSASGTEVPRSKLLHALKSESTLFTTQNLTRDEIYVDIHMPL